MNSSRSIFRMLIVLSCFVITNIFFSNCYASIQSKAKSNAKKQRKIALKNEKIAEQKKQAAEESFRNKDCESAKKFLTESENAIAKAKARRCFAGYHERIADYIKGYYPPGITLPNTVCPAIQKHYQTHANLRTLFRETQCKAKKSGLFDNSSADKWYEKATRFRKQGKAGEAIEALKVAAVVGNAQAAEVLGAIYLKNKDIWWAQYWFVAADFLSDSERGQIQLLYGSLVYDGWSNRSYTYIDNKVPSFGYYIRQRTKSVQQTALFHGIDTLCYMTYDYHRHKFYGDLSWIPNQKTIERAVAFLNAALVNGSENAQSVLNKISKATNTGSDKWTAEDWDICCKQFVDDYINPDASYWINLWLIAYKAQK